MAATPEEISAIERVIAEMEPVCCVSCDEPSAVLPGTPERVLLAAVHIGPDAVRLLLIADCLVSGWGLTHTGLDDDGNVVCPVLVSCPACASAGELAYAREEYAADGPMTSTADRVRAKHQTDALLREHLERPMSRN